MDELTRERYPHGVPYRERYAQPGPVPVADVAARRLVLCGTADAAELGPGGNRPGTRRRRRLVETIRRWVA